MKTAKRLLSLLLCLLLLSGTALAASGKNSQDVVIRKVPEWNDAWWLLRYQMLTMTEAFKRLL